VKSTILSSVVMALHKVDYYDEDKLQDEAWSEVHHARRAE
jgi:hypothetical protein